MIQFFKNILCKSVIIFLSGLVFSCNQKPKLVEVDPAFSQYIDAYTSGVVSKKNTIRIQLASDVSTTHSVNDTIKNKLFSFSPSVDGKAYWVDARTIEFKPNNDLTPDQLYEVNFKLGDVIKVPSKFDEFKFNIQIVKPSFEVHENGLRSNNKTAMNLSGKILTADVEQSASIEKLLTASINGKQFPISWQHNETAKEHQFVINNIPRTNAAQKLLLQWKGDAINSKQQGDKAIEVPTLGDFKLLDVRASDEDEQYALVQFSDPISAAQNLDGLITISNVENPAYTILGSEVKVYVNDALDGNYTVNVLPGIENQTNDKLKKSYTSNGGDAEAEIASNTRRANRFKPVVEFMGPFTLNGGSKTHNFILPACMGSVRAMVIAAGDDAYGFADKDVTVKKPLMILPTLPRVVGPGEEVKIPVTVFATENNIKNVSLSIQTNPFITANGNQTISFAKPGEQQAYFYAKVNNATGIGNIKIVATSGGEQTIYQTEIDVRNPNPYTTQVTETTLQAGQSWSSTVSMIGDVQSSKATLEISSIPAIDLEKRLTYLITYPHGCIEQTTSSVFPQLYLNQLMNLNDKQKAEIDRNIKAALQRYNNFQQSDGGFSYWPNEGESDEWGSNYAGHFLLIAQSKGYNVSSSMLQQWKQYERLKALAWNVTSAPYYGTDLMQSYRLYLLALSGSPELGAMNRLKEWKFLSPEGKWRLAAAYQLIGQTKVALQLISGLSTSFPERKNPGITFGSDLRDQAMVLETLVTMKRNAEANQLVKTVAAKLSQDDWYSTQTTAYSLIAIAEYAGSNKSNQKIIVAGKSGNQNISINSSSVVAQNAMQWQNGKANVQLQNKGSNVLFVRVINEGKPISGENISFTNDPNILKVNVSYVTTSGNAINIDSIKQGTDFVAKVVVTNPDQRDVYTNMALSEIFPSGWEILNTRLYNSEGSFESSPSDYMDIRDNRVYYYFDLKPYESKTYYVQLNAAYLGKYYWPGIYCEAMYYHTISDGVKGKWLKVVE